MEKIMYTPTPDDEVQITRKFYGFNCYFGIIKKEKLSILDKIKKWLKIADEWIDYKYVYDIQDNGNFYDNKLNYNSEFFEFIETKYDIRNKLWKSVKVLSKNFIKDGFTIYGTVYGKGIHSTFDYNLDTIEFVGTDIFENKNFVAPDSVKLIFDTVLDLPHVEIFHTGEWNKDIQDQYVYNNYVEGTNNTLPHAGVVVKHVSGDREKIVTIYNPEFMVFIGKTI
jgi:asparagine N-glycosylation enzyme membrane subunit Stt3